MSTNGGPLVSMCGDGGEHPPEGDGKQRDENDGWMHDCLLICRDGGPTMFVYNRGTLRPTLDGYAIIPREEYDRLKALAGEVWESK